MIGARPLFWPARFITGVYFPRFKRGGLFRRRPDFRHPAGWPVDGRLGDGCQLHRGRPGPLLPQPNRSNFNCGPLPQTITLTAPLSVSTALVINGGNKVTLNSSGSSNFFNVQAGGHLTLNQMSLTNGHSASCGGAIHVLANGLLTLNDARFTNNSSTTTGGALCVDANGEADMTSGLFSGNHANNGGAIINSGTLNVTSAVFISNTVVFMAARLKIMPMQRDFEQL